MLDDLPAERPTVSPVLAFWQGLTRPHAGTALAAVLLALTGWTLLAVSSTEARVRATDTASWLRNSSDGWCHLNAVAIQGAARHARGPGQTVVWVGPSMLQSLLPPPSELEAAQRAAAPHLARAVQLAAPALDYAEAAAVVDKFGAGFDGWFVVAVNRHTLGRVESARDMVRAEGGLTLGFASTIRDDERRRSGRPVEFRSGIPLLDFPAFYLASLGGWRHTGRAPPVFGAAAPARGWQPPTEAATRLMLPAYVPEAEARNLALLGRIAVRLRAGGGARLAVVELPFADEVMPALQDALWRKAKARFAARRSAWSQESGVPWLDVSGSLELRAEDFADPLHVGTEAARKRFVGRVANWLAELGKT